MENRKYFRILAKVGLATGDNVWHPPPMAARRLATEARTSLQAAGTPDSFVLKLIDALTALEREIEFLHRQVMAKGGAVMPTDHLVELSAGGIRFLGGPELVDTDRVPLTVFFDLDGHTRWITVDARIVAKQPADHRFEISCSFDNIDEDDGAVGEAHCGGDL